MADEDLRIVGVEQLTVVSRLLREVADGGLRKEMLSGIQRAAKPLKEAAQRSAEAKLPHGGGLNEFVANGKISVGTRGGGRDPGVRIKARRGASADRGRLRHPVFGNRDVWVEQTVPPGWFSEPMEEGAEGVRHELLDVLDAVARRLADG